MHDDQWPLGFPLPHRMVLFFPFFAATFGVVHGLLGAAASLGLVLDARRRSTLAPQPPRLP